MNDFTHTCSTENKTEPMSKTKQYERNKLIKTREWQWSKTKMGLGTGQRS